MWQWTQLRIGEQLESFAPPPLVLKSFTYVKKKNKDFGQLQKQKKICIQAVSKYLRLLHVSYAR